MDYHKELEKISKAKYNSETERNEAIIEFKSNNKEPKEESKKSLFSRKKKA